MGDRFAGGIGQIIQRQNDDVIADTDSAVLAAVAPYGFRNLFTGPGLPPLGLGIVNVHVMAFGDGLHGAADVVSVLVHGIAFGDVL